MNKYNTTKFSGIDWLGKIPEHWKLKRLKNVANYIQTGITPPSENEEYFDGEIPWYGPIDFSEDIILRNPVKYITRKAIDDKVAKLFPIDCTFMIGIGATIGKVGIIKEPSSCNQQLNTINFKNSIDADFGVYFLKIYEDIIIKIANFSTLPIYNQVQTGNLKFLLPPIEEQIKIANYLYKEIQRIDRLIANKKAQTEKLKELRRIEINNAVMKGLNTKIELKDSGIDYLGKIPMHWAVKRLKNLAKQVSDKSIEISGDDFIVALENIESNTGAYIETSSEYDNNGIRFKQNHILYNKLRPYLNKVYKALTPGICVGDIIVIECGNKLHPTFLHYKLLSDSINSKVMSSVYGTKMPRTSWEFISNMKIGFPCVEEQIQIANYLQQRCSSIDKLIKNIEVQVEKLQEVRKIKIFEAVTGKIRVNSYVETTE